MLQEEVRSGELGIPADATTTVWDGSTGIPEPHVPDPAGFWVAASQDWGGG
ncbi:hypothetical protein [Thermostichus vulcanus]|uniref:Uncharacterized protein n=1 Tax=Thermostichus vulcanus str. 'Rupite' TaxID=2813851 RepID=A0ABT0C8A1_THEVL|nr:hypothetical protein [Thermostichus vulcanus]MCJ2542017.1 hypothetical protein [Thermostichus vulcanus str. 'Rupite']